MNKIASVSFGEIEGIPQIVKEFLEKKIENAQTEVFSIENIKEKIKEKTASYLDENRKTLVQVLKNQMHTAALSDRQINNLDLLQKSNTFTVTTGHQLNLFSGSVFFIYKILQTISLAEELSKKLPENHFVPVFWLATEDHDFEEIRSFRTANATYTMNAEAGTAVGRIKVEDTAFIAQFKDEMKDFPYGDRLIGLMEACYKEGKTLSEAMRMLVQDLFASFGLLIIDGDEAELKRMMAGAFGRELKEELLFCSTKNQVEKLVEKYGKVQVNPREINLFYLDKERTRIVKDRNGRFAILGTEKTFSEEEIMEELGKYPEKFSPNAVFRPSYQETILPNIAYIGGNAEVAYWLELKDFFEAINLPFPVLIPRHSMLWLTEKQAQKMEKYHILPREITKKADELMKNRFLKNDELETTIEEGKNMLCMVFKSLKESAKHTDITFLNLVVAEEQRQMKSFAKMKKRLYRAERKRNEEKVAEFLNWYEKIHPKGTWQERVYNFSNYYATEGEAWIQECYNAMKETEPKLIIMKL